MGIKLQEFFIENLFKARCTKILVKLIAKTSNSKPEQFDWPAKSNLRTQFFQLFIFATLKLQSCTSLSPSGIKKVSVINPVLPEEDVGNSQCIKHHIYCSFSLKTNGIKIFLFLVLKSYFTNFTL